MQTVLFGVADSVGPIGRCDSPSAPDGSFTRCDTVYVLGFGGTNCCRVDPTAP
jgi:hypothetical protein